MAVSPECLGSDSHPPDVPSLSHSLSLSLPQLCASSLHLVILLSHMECEGSSGAGEREGGGDYTDCYCVRCVCQMHVSWFMYTLLRPVCVYFEHPPRHVSNKPAGIIDTTVCVCAGCVCVCEVR